MIRNNLPVTGGSVRRLPGCRSWLASILLVFVVINVLLGTFICHAMPTPDEESFNREYGKDLTGWLAALGPPPPLASPAFAANLCPHYSSNSVALPRYPSASSPYYVPLDKRNSELINSLLTLPKNNLNAVGK